MREYQQAKLYRWEEFVRQKYDTPRRTLASARRLVTFACRFLNSWPVKVIINPKLSTYAGQYDKTIKTIELHPKWILDIVILHELTHEFHTNHDARFIATLCKLLNRYNRIPKKFLRTSLDKFGLDYKEF